MADNKPRIFITGDSWGVKEWTPHNANDSAEEMDRAAHRGIHTFFKKDGYEVHNLSSGGSSNNESIDRLIKYLNAGKITYTDTDFIFWIITDPIRDLRPYHEPELKLTDELWKNNGWNDLIAKLFHDQCSRANQIAEQYNLKIYIIGGITSFTKEEVAPYTNLIPIVPSWYELLLNPVEKMLVPKRPIWTSQTSDVHITDIELKYIATVSSNKLSKRIINEFWEINEFHRIVHNANQYFQLDNSHPDRHGHRLLYDQLLQHIENGQT